MGLSWSLEELGSRACHIRVLLSRTVSGAVCVHVFERSHALHWLILASFSVSRARLRHPLHQHIEMTLTNRISASTPEFIASGHDVRSAKVFAHVASVATSCSCPFSLMIGVSMSNEHARTNTIVEVGGEQDLVHGRVRRIGWGKEAALAPESSRLL